MMIEAQKLRWCLYNQQDSKFIYRLYIEIIRDRFLHLNVQERCPGPGKKIFCQYLGNCSISDLPYEEPLRICSIVKQKRYGKRLIIILGRKTRKRGWFIFLKKGL